MLVDQESVDSLQPTTCFVINGPFITCHLWRSWVVVMETTESSKPKVPFGPLQKKRVPTLELDSHPFSGAPESLAQVRKHLCGDSVGRGGT